MADHPKPVPATISYEQSESDEPTSCLLRSPFPQEVRSILLSLKKDPFGIIHTGRDGIVRSMTPSRTVIDAIPLNPEQIQLFLKANPPPVPVDVTGIDGTEVPRERWYSIEHMREEVPAPVNAEGDAKIRELEREDPELWRMKRESFAREYEEGKAARALAGTL